MRFFIFLSYKGTRYYGWQRQKNAVSVQETVENALSAILRHKVEVIGAGRTDTGVHASFYAAHFDFVENISNLNDLVYHLNRMLPTDIAIKTIQPVVPEAHARFSALYRTYQYVISTSKNPFEEDLSWWLLYKLDIDKMNKAAQYLVEVNDFTAFAKLHSNNKNNLCRVISAQFHTENEKIIFTITANRFLRNMVRAIVGNLVDIGRGKMEIDFFIKSIEQKNRKLASNTAPACGLYLSFISYPDEIFLKP